MATYVKGADTYLPDIKPFTPDYKFLSAVLETRTDKYDANFKATNDVYNRVVYADMSRQDNIEKRDQFADNIAPQIEKISGMDLSLQQNATAAQGVFKPFWDDNLIVRDVVYTSKYRDEMIYANRLQDSPDRKLNDKFWDVGMRDMQYRMNDFINSDPSKALQMAMPKFVEDVDLVQLSQDLLGELDPPLKMKADRFAQNGDLIITEQNGRLVAGKALEYIQSSLQNNPKVQAAYKADAFVKSRDFASAAIEAGRFQTVEEGQSAWAQETIRRIDLRNNIDLNKKQVEGAQLEATNVSWNNYQAIHGIVPGSDMETVMQEKMSAAVSTQAAIDRMKGISHTVKSPTKSVDGNLNKAYSLLMQQNIGRDMRKGATLYASRDQEYKITESQRGLKKLQHGYNIALARENSRLKGLEIQLAAKLKNPASGNNPLAEASKQNVITYNDPNTIKVATNEDGEVVNDVNIIEKVAGEIVKVDNSLAEKQVAMMFKAMALTQGRGNSVYTEQDGQNGLIPKENKVGDTKNDFQFTIPFPTPDDPTGTITGTQRTLTERLLKRNESGSGFINRDIINQAYAKEEKTITNSKELFSRFPNTDKESYTEVYNQMFGDNSIRNQQIFLDEGVQRTYEDVRKAYDVTKKLAFKEESNLKLLEDAGFPEVIGEDNIPLTKAEYIVKVTEGVKDGSITNPDLWGWDTGTSNKDYMIPAYKLSARTGKGGTKEYVKVYANDGSMMLDEEAVADEAGTMFDKILTTLNKGLTGGYSDLQAIPSAGFFATIDGRTGDFATVNQTGSYETSYNPLAPDAMATAITTDMVMQVNSLREKGKGYGILSGDIDNIDADDLLKNDANALKIYNLWLEDVNSWENNPKRSNTDAIAPVARIVHKPVFGQSGDMIKDQSAYTIVYSPEWLASKVKGANKENVSAQYGALTTDEIDELEGMTTIYYNQNDDISARSQGNQYYSSVQSNILYERNLRGGQGDYADYIVPGPGLVNTAEYSISKTGLGYDAVGTENIYIPYNPENKTGGKYVTQSVTQSFDMSLGLRGVDRQASALRMQFEKTVARNKIMLDLDQSKYGIKEPILNNY